MRMSRTLLMLLAFAAFVAAESLPECKEGLDKLLNKSGQSPCAVGKQMMRGCEANPYEIGQCKCNTIMYNVQAACAACSGDAPPSWADWADDQSCGSNPEQPPSNFDVAHGTIPQWAYQPLTQDNDFDMGSAILAANGTGSTLTTTSSGTTRSNVAVQVGVPIAAGIGVAIIAIAVFWLYWHRRTRRHDPRMKTLPLIPGAQSTLWRPWRWFYTVWPGARSRRLRPSKKNSDWAIDEDTEWLGHARPHSSTSYVDPYTLGARSPEPLEMDVPHTSAHIQETSSSSLLPHLDFPDVRVPTFFERFIKSKDGVRKSPAYKSKYVSPVSPDPQFRIDGSAGPTPVANSFAVEETKRSSLGRSNGASLSLSVAQSSKTQPIVTERNDFQPASEAVGSSVLIISHDGRDFTFDDSATTAPSHSHPSSPRAVSTFRQASTMYSGSRTNTGTGTGTGSWLPSPNRANTSSTLSGAYPTALRYDPELMSGRTWASHFPAPPQTFTQSPTAFQSFSEQMEQPSEHAPKL